MYGICKRVLYIVSSTNCAKPLFRKSQFNLIKINNDKKKIMNS